MSLKYAIVGFLLERPMHGYELKQALSPALGREGQVNDGILYPLLAKLTKDGFVKKKVVEGEGGPPRHVLFPTRKGEAWFRAWLEGDQDEEDEITYAFFVGHPFLAKCIFFKLVDSSGIVRKLENQKRAAEHKFHVFSEIRAKLVRRKVDLHRIAVLDLGILQQQQKIRWLKRELKREQGSRKTRSES